MNNFILRVISGVFLLIIGISIYYSLWIKNIFTGLLFLGSLYELRQFSPIKTSIILYAFMIANSCISAFFIDHTTIFFLLVCAWMHDVGGYFFGKLIGGPKIIPSVSPNKTWSGFIGGWILISIFLVYWNKGHNIYIAIEIALLINAICLTGDLIESKLKRLYAVKDSGTIIPGHGGVLDRFDAFLFLNFCYILTRTFWA